MVLNYYLQIHHRHVGKLTKIQRQKTITKFCSSFTKVFKKIIESSNFISVWDILVKNYWGNTKVKKVKFQTSRRHFEIMEMKSDEKVGDYFTRLVTFTNQMKKYGNTMKNEAVIEKVLRTLAIKFDHIVVTIEETNEPSDIKTLEAFEINNWEEEAEQQFFLAR